MVFVSLFNTLSIVLKLFEKRENCNMNIDFKKCIFYLKVIMFGELLLDRK